MDCGEGTQHQILHTNLSLSSLNTIFITHVHGDHCFGLPGLLASATMSGRTAPLTIVCPNALEKWLKTTFEITKMNFSYELKFQAIENCASLELDDFNIDLAKLSHRVPSYAFGFTENNLKRKLNIEKLIKDQIPQGSLWGKLQNEQNILDDNGNTIHFEAYLLPKTIPRKIVIAGDNDEPQLLKEIVKNTSVLVHEATFTQEILEKVGKGPQHSSAKQIALFSEQQSIPNLILTHFSARYKGDVIDEIQNEAEKHYHGNLFLANDFDVFWLDKECVLSV